VNVPPAVRLGKVDHVILDCDYALENTSSRGLVVKWFFNDEQVVYQWIHGMHPVANELIARYVDLEYKASDDPFTEYRAIKLDKPGIDLTGDYTCVISTFQDERRANAYMIVYCEHAHPSFRLIPPRDRRLRERCTPLDTRYSIVFATPGRRDP
jgi:hypothetical protein